MKYSKKNLCEIALCIFISFFLSISVVGFYICGIVLLLINYHLLGAILLIALIFSIGLTMAAMEDFTD